MRQACRLPDTDTRIERFRRLLKHELDAAADVVRADVATASHQLVVKPDLTRGRFDQADDGATNVLVRTQRRDRPLRAPTSRDHSRVASEFLECLLFGLMPFFFIER